MNTKEIADRIDHILKAYPEPGLREEIIKLRNELRPPLKDASPVVYWRYKYKGPPDYSCIGIVDKFRNGVYDHNGDFHSVHSIEWVDAPITRSQEVRGLPGELVKHNGKTYKILEIVPVDEWHKTVHSIVWRMVPRDDACEYTIALREEMERTDDYRSDHTATRQEAMDEVPVRNKAIRNHIQSAIVALNAALQEDSDG